MHKISKELAAEISRNPYITIIFVENGDCYIKPQNSFGDVAQIIDDVNSGDTALTGIEVFSKLDIE